MIVTAIDPGTRESAVVEWNGKLPSNAAVVDNEELAQILRKESFQPHPLVIEKVESMGMAVGVETFETVYWSGIFAEAYGLQKVHRMGRKAVKLHHCGSTRATDSNIRQALLDRFGGSGAFGTKRLPGPLFGVTGHKLAALALAIAWFETEGPRVDRQGDMK